jgi:hypothetical protein
LKHCGRKIHLQQVAKLAQPWTHQSSRKPQRISLSAGKGGPGPMGDEKKWRALMVILMGFVRIETSFFVNGIQWVL